MLIVSIKMDREDILSDSPENDLVITDGDTAQSIIQQAIGN
jgi:hypothetical protein